MIYISGPITGTDDYMERFDAAEKMLAEKGCAVVNPARYNARLPEEMEYKDYMQVSLALLGACDTIYMLKGWQDSKGARLEHAYAEAMGIEIIYQESTPPEEKKYYWHLKGKFTCNTYLNLVIGICLSTKSESPNVRTKFTESEYKDLAKRFNFSEDMFVKEEIQ